MVILTVGTFVVYHQTGHRPIPTQFSQIYIFVVYTETIAVSFSKTCTLKPIFESLCFQATKMQLLCKWTTNAHKSFLFSWKQCCVNTPLVLHVVWCVRMNNYMSAVGMCGRVLQALCSCRWSRVQSGIWHMCPVPVQWTQRLVWSWNSRLPGTYTLNESVCELHYSEWIMSFLIGLAYVRVSHWWRVEVALHSEYLSNGINEPPQMPVIQYPFSN